MYPRPFRYLAPGGISEALSTLADDEDSRIVGGGMSVILMMKMRLLRPGTLVDLRRIPGVDTITEDDTLSIGAMVRHHGVAADPRIRHHAAALAEAASWTGDAQVRNRGTLCGSLAHGDAAADQPAAVLALQGTITARSTSGARNIPAEEFFLDLFTTALQPAEILTEVAIPRSNPEEGSAYEKVGRRGTREGFAVVGVAAWVRLVDGIVDDVRVALTRVRFTPLLAKPVRDALVTTDASPTAVRNAASFATDGVHILADLHGSVAYKTHLAQVLTGRALQRAVARARPPDGVSPLAI